MEPKTGRDRDDFLNVYLGEYERWGREMARTKKVAMEQERLMDKFRKEKGVSEAWTEAD